MGLDIIAYSKLEPKRDDRVAEVMDSLFIPQGEWVIEFQENEERPRCQDMKPGTWHMTDETKSMDFRAGAYSTYNTFRRILANAILGVTPETVWENEDDFENSPFYEIINFSDCEGAFGPCDSEKLHHDFVNHEKQFKEYIIEEMGKYDTDVEWYSRIYDNFTEAFKLAADDGVLIFC